MDTLIVVSIVLLAVLFIARRVFVSVRAARNAKAGCESDCGCSPAASAKSDWSKS